MGAGASSAAQGAIGQGGEAEALITELRTHGLVVAAEKLEAMQTVQAVASDPAPARAPLRRVALLTAGGLAPCLSSAVAALIERYTELMPDVEIITYIGGFKGLLTGNFQVVSQQVRRSASCMHLHGGSPIGNSRVKLTNIRDCVRRGYVNEGEDPQRVAAEQLVKDNVEVLHTIGGDDTNTAAADLATFLESNDYNLTVIGLPKTIDNDVYPIKQTLGAWTAAEEGARFFANVVYEQSSNPRMLIIHEIMGRHCGYLTAATARHYRAALKRKGFLPGLGLCFERLDVHAIYIPELGIDLHKEAERLKTIMDQIGCVNIFLSEGAGVEDVIREMEAKGQAIPTDSFGHYKLDAVNPGEYFGREFAALIGAEKVMVQKSGYFSRAAKANQSDVALIKSCCDLAVECAVSRTPGVIGHDEDHNGKLRAIEFSRIRGGKPFDVNQLWFKDMMSEVLSPVQWSESEQAAASAAPEQDAQPALDEEWFRDSLEVLSPIHWRVAPKAAAQYIPRLPAGLHLPRKVAILSAGGLAPCVSSAVGGLIERYNELYPSVEIICYLSGFKGLLLGRSVPVLAEERAQAGILHLHGGSPIGSSRVKLTNVEDCVRRQLVNEGDDPQRVAADQLVRDGIDVLHTVGDDEDNAAAADLAAYLRANEYDLTVIGLPKTIDNDVAPFRQTLGALTAAEEGAKYFANVVYENTANPRMLIVHEVMGRGCGYLTAATARVYRSLIKARGGSPGLCSSDSLDVNAVFIPELPVNIHAEAARLKERMNQNDCVNIFISEGAGVEAIIREKEANGEAVPRDAFGNVKLDAVKPGEWFGKQFASMIGAEKVLVQKSGYYSRSAPANSEDLRMIKSCTDLAVECALRKEAGVVGHDDERGNVLRAVEFERIKGGKPFDVNAPWFREMLVQIGQQVHYKENVRMAVGCVENMTVRINATINSQSASLF